MPQATRTHKQEIKGNNKLEFEFSSKPGWSKEPFTILENIQKEQINFLAAILQQNKSFLLHF